MSGQPAMDPAMVRSIDAVLARVKEPETGRSVADLNLVQRVTYSQSERVLQVVTLIDTSRSTCIVCDVVTGQLRHSIERNLRQEFGKEFPELTIDIVSG